MAGCLHTNFCKHEKRKRERSYELSELSTTYIKVYNTWRKLFSLISMAVAWLVHDPNEWSEIQESAILIMVLHYGGDSAKWLFHNIYLWFYVWIWWRWLPYWQYLISSCIQHFCLISGLTIPDWLNSQLYESIQWISHGRLLNQHLTRLLNLHMKNTIVIYSKY